MILLCLKIFAARIIDVTLGTVKTFFIFKEKRITSFIISFFELHKRIDQFSLFTHPFSPLQNKTQEQKTSI